MVVEEIVGFCGSGFGAEVVSGGLFGSEGVVEPGVRETKGFDMLEFIEDCVVDGT